MEIYDAEDVVVIVPRGRHAYVYAPCDDEEMFSVCEEPSCDDPEDCEPYDNAPPCPEPDAPTCAE